MYEILVLHCSVLDAVLNAVFKTQKIKKQLCSNTILTLKESNFHSFGAQ